MKVHGVGKRLVVTALLLTGCGGGSDALPAPTPTPTEAIATAGPTPTSPASPPTAASTPSPSVTASPTPTPEPTPTPDPRVEQDAAVIAAWERYLELSFAARGKDPSEEALDFDSYVTGGAKDGLLGAIERDVANDRYLTGTVRSTDPTLSYNDAGDARISDCIDVDLASSARSDDSPGETEVRLVAAEARLVPREGGWVVAAYLTEDLCGG